MASLKFPKFTTKGSAAESRKRGAADLAQREASPTILSPADILGEYDAARLLMTTQGGVLRPVTDADLRAFAKNAQTLGKRFKGGITPQGIIESSRQEDRERANRQINLAVPYASKGGTLKVTTNAGPDSDVVRHFVTVEFVNFDAAVASPKTPAQMAEFLTRGQVKFDCDCGRHTYWYRYIATIGRFNAGRPETGYPKIRNPNLSGVGCKHVLRTMANLRQGLFKNYVGKMIDQARKKISAQTAARQVPPSVVRDIIAEQRAGVPRIRTRAQASAAARKSPNAKLKATAKKAIEAIAAKQQTSAKIARAQIANLRRLGVITQRQADTMLARLKD